MSIQKYILPEWKKAIQNSDIPEDLRSQYQKMGYSMAEYLDRQMMRKLPENWFTGWLRYHFPLKVDEKIINLHKIIAESFGEFVLQYRSGNKGEYNIPDEDISQIQELQEELFEQKDNKKKKIHEIKQEVENIRDKQRKNKPPRESKTVTKKKSDTKTTSKPSKPESEEVEIDHDEIYEKWLKHVEQKSISKSYKAIHDYMSKYIMEFAEEHSDDGKVTLDIVNAFLEEFGKDKRPKTMNHYNRVALKYFWPFYEELVYGKD